MDVERLILCVRRHVFLYDVTHREYKNTGLKAVVWESIARELNMSSDVVKQKWKVVRDSYIKYKKQLQKAALPTGSGKRVVEYVWSSQLKFLDDYYTSRKTSFSNSDNTSVSLQLDSSQDDALMSHSSYQVLIGSSETGSSSYNDELSSQRRSDQDLYRKHSYYDATDHLFLSYSETFKTFSPRQQALLKIELAKLFSNAELKELDNVDIIRERMSSNDGGSSPAYSLIKAECRGEPIGVTQDILEAYEVSEDPSEPQAKRRREDT